MSVVSTDKVPLLLSVLTCQLSVLSKRKLGGNGIPDPRFLARGDDLLFFEDRPHGDERIHLPIKSAIVNGTSIDFHFVTLAQKVTRGQSLVGSEHFQDGLLHCIGARLFFGGSFFLPFFWSSSDDHRRSIVGVF